MKKLLLTILIVTVYNNLHAQVYNGPDFLRPSSTDNYASVTMPAGVNVTWSISANGQIQGASNKQIAFFNVIANTAPIVITATFSNGTNIVKTIPIVPLATELLENASPVSVSNGTRQYRITQLLRGQRVKITPANFGGPNPTLTLLSSQGRIIQQGNLLDFRSPTRGLFYVVVNAVSSGQLLVEGINAATTPIGSNNSTTLTQPSCTFGTITKQIESNANYTGAEYMVTLGNRVITCVYDFVLNKTKINAYENDLLVWSWLSGTNEYVRTITADPVFGIAGIGSAGGALGVDDNVIVVKLNANGTLQQTTTFGTTGKDFGYGVSFANDGSLVATGFTDGSFAGFTNAGELDGFATRISTAGTIVATKQFGTSGNDRVFASRTLANGNILLFGDTEGLIGTVSTVGPRAFDLFLTEWRLNDYSFVNNRQYGTNENDLAFDFVIEPVTGDIFITGQTTGEFLPGSNTTTNGNPQQTQVYTARINKTTGSLIWVRQLGPNDGQSAESICLTNQGVGTIFYTFGSFNGANNNSLGTPASDDMVISLFDLDGNIKKLYQFDQTFERIFARAITFKNNDMYVLRDHVYEPGRPFITTSLDKISIAPPIVDNPINTSDKLSIYPNPSAELINVKAVNGYVIYDAKGSVIKQSNRPTQTIDIKNLSSGLYFIVVDNKVGRFIKE